MHFHSVHSKLYEDRRPLKSQCGTVGSRGTDQVKLPLSEFNIPQV